MKPGDVLPMAAGRALDYGDLRGACGTCGAAHRRVEAADDGDVAVEVIVCAACRVVENVAVLGRRQ